MSWDSILQVELGWMRSFHDLIWQYKYTGPIMEAITYLGKAHFALLVAFLVALLHDGQRGRRLWFLLAFGMLLNATLKDFFHEMRPFVYDPALAHFSAPDTYAFPSGHSEVAVILFGTLAMWEKSSWRKWLYLDLIVLVGISRVALGVHFPTDVLAGWFEGFVVLGLGCWFQCGKAPVLAKIKSNIALGLGLSALFVGLVLQVVSYGFIWLIAGSMMAAVWTLYRNCKANLNSLAPLAQTCGFMLGVYIIGLLLDVRCFTPGFALMAAGAFMVWFFLSCYACCVKSSLK